LSFNPRQCHVWNNIAVTYDLLSEPVKAANAFDKARFYLPLQQGNGQMDSSITIQFNLAAHFIETAKQQMNPHIREQQFAAAKKLLNYLKKELENKPEFWTLFGTVTNKYLINKILNYITDLNICTYHFSHVSFVFLFSF
jgi:hypothetical protein